MKWHIKAKNGIIWRKIERKKWQKLSEILRNGKKHGKMYLTN